MLDGWQEKQLRDLCYHWGEVFDIVVTDGIWTARFMGEAQAEVLRAESAELLRNLIRADYLRRKRARF